MNHQSPIQRLLPGVRPIAAGIFVFLSGQVVCGAVTNQRFDDSGSNSITRSYAKPFGYPDPALGATPNGSTITVQNCHDAGNGSLRAAIGAAQSGDTVDLSQLSCATITLITGQITVAQDDLILSGSAADLLTIDGGVNGGHHNRIFNHTGTGVLQISNLTLADAEYETAARGAAGGCVLSKGTVSFSHSVLNRCVTLEQGNFTASAGAISAKNIVLQHSEVSGNSALGSSMSGDEGGAMACYNGKITIKYSTISNNTAIGDNTATGTNGLGGAISASSCDIYIMGSTFSGNYATSYGAIHADLAGDALAHTVQIFNTTISGNHATGITGGIGVAFEDFTLANSTITENVADFGTVLRGSGLRTLGAKAVRLQSSIIANNTSGNNDDDANVDTSATVSGNNNLITHHTGPMPSGTITACPKLAPLDDNGGETQTHRLLAGSPAIGAGNNEEKGFSFDQRGSGFPRMHGSSTDIGAFEDQGVRTDAIFIAGFEGRCR
jgi:hypothetical protein